LTCSLLATLRAYLLAVYATWFPAGTIFLGVVDPDVGGARPPIIIEADDRWCVGPGNGLFELVQRRAAVARSWHIDWKPEHLSSSFHGRDLFAPVAAILARGEPPPAGPAKMVRIAAQIGRMTSARLCMLIISATP
jgi:S-adenosyl-L-methionine hydrolase (adenosine-forming)